LYERQHEAAYVLSNGVIVDGGIADGLGEAEAGGSSNLVGSD